MRSTESNSDLAPHSEPCSGDGSHAIRHLVHVFPSFGIGGQQVRFADIVNRLDGTFRHTVVALDGVTTAESLIKTGVALNVDISCARKTNAPRPHILQACDLLKRLNPTLLLTYNWGAAEWALANRIWLRLPHLHFEDGFGADESATHQLRRRILFRRLALGGSMTKIVVPSQQLHHLATDNWRFNPSKVFHVPNGIDCAQFLGPPDPKLSEYIDRQSNEVVVGTVAALRPEKNLSRLIRAFAALPTSTRTRLVIAGDGPTRPSLELLAHELGLEDRVLFLGAVAGANRVLGLFDLFALSSDTEQMPYSVLEAMAAGLPVVCTDVGDIRLVVAEGNRQFIVPCTDEARFVTALAALICNSDLRSTLGRSNSDRVQQMYGVNAMFANYEALIDETLKPMRNF